jgi:hypothetical protein
VGVGLGDGVDGVDGVEGAEGIGADVVSGGASGVVGGAAEELAVHAASATMSGARAMRLSIVPFTSRMRTVP